MIKKSSYKKTECCYWCGVATSVKKRTREHLVPLSLGGTNTASNLEMACIDCNTERGTLTSRSVNGEVFVRDFYLSSGVARKGVARHNLETKKYEKLFKKWTELETERMGFSPHADLKFIGDITQEVIEKFHSQPVTEEFICFWCDRKAPSFLKVVSGIAPRRVIHLRNDVCECCPKCYYSRKRLFDYGMSLKRELQRLTKIMSRQNYLYGSMLKNIRNLKENIRLRDEELAKWLAIDESKFEEPPLLIVRNLFDEVKCLEC